MLLRQHELKKRRNENKTNNKKKKARRRDWREEKKAGFTAEGALVIEISFIGDVRISIANMSL